MTAEQNLQLIIGGYVMQIAALTAEITRLQALIPVKEEKST